MNFKRSVLRTSMKRPFPRTAEEDEEDVVAAETPGTLADQGLEPAVIVSQTQFQFQPVRGSRFSGEDLGPIPSPDSQADTIHIMVMCHNEFNLYSHATTQQ